MTTIEELGLLKMDFLGLRTLTVIQNACKLVEMSQGIRIDIDQIDFDDKAVYDSLGTFSGIPLETQPGTPSFGLP